MKRILYNTKLQTKFLLITLITGIFVCIGNLLAFQILQTVYSNELYNKSVQLLTLFAENVQAELGRVAYDSENIISDEVLQKSLSAMKNNSSMSEWISANREVTKRIESMDFYSEDINYVYLISADGGKYGRFDVDNNMSVENIEELIALAHQAKGREVWAVNSEIEDSLIFVREVREAKDFTLERLGTLMIKVDLADIVKRTNKVLYDTGTSIRIAIYQEEARMYASDKLVSELPLKKGGYDIYETEEGKVLSSYYTFKENGWTYVTILPYTNIFQSVNRAFWISLVVLGSIVLLTLWINNKLTRSIIKHIENLTRQCDIFAKGEYVPIREEYRFRKDEIGRLYRHFDKMTAENEKMIQEIYVKQQLLLEAQVSNLRAQIRPHFIYNTLESIYCLAQADDNERIATMTAALGKLLRMSLMEQRDLIPLKEDMEMVKEYVKIQSVRFGERLKININIQERYEDIAIPCMSIQPLVENAILYGMEEMLDICEISVYCRERAGMVEIVVEDNGPGIDTDIITKLETKQIVPKGLGIGLENINKRLKMLVSSDSGVIAEREGEKTFVIIRLPM